MRVPEVGSPLTDEQVDWLADQGFAPETVLSVRVTTDSAIQRVEVEHWDPAWGDQPRRTEILAGARGRGRQITPPFPGMSP